MVTGRSRRFKRANAGRWLAVVIVAATAGLALGHAIVIAPRYHLGSFDDDASYVEMALALARGHGLTSLLTAGYPLGATYPAGYPALLAVVHLAGGGIGAYRLLSLLLLAAAFPLLWVYNRRQGLSIPIASSVLVLLALNPVYATYGTMVMAETAFVTALLLLLCTTQRWMERTGTFGVAGIATIVLAASLPWFKEAGIGAVAGLVLWLGWRRCWRRATAVAAGTAALLAPLVVARFVTGTPLLGSRYSSEISGNLAGGLVHRVAIVAPTAVLHYISPVFGESMAPVGWPPLWEGSPLRLILDVARWTAFPIVCAGAVVWQRRYGGPAVAIAAAYL
ncbi:MAG TPA: hypothetical protein VGH94_12695, partial [Acidimicrobiales bacterium]